MLLSRSYYQTYYFWVFLFGPMVEYSVVWFYLFGPKDLVYEPSHSASKKSKNKFLKVISLHLICNNKFNEITAKRSAPLKQV